MADAAANAMKLIRKLVFWTLNCAENRAILNRWKAGDAFRNPIADRCKRYRVRLRRNPGERFTSLFRNPSKSFTKPARHETGDKGFGGG